MTTTIRNLTPHAVNLYSGAAIDTAASKRGDIRLAADATPTVTFPPDGVVARAAEVGGEEAGNLYVARSMEWLPPYVVPVCAPVRFAATVDLPAPVDGVALIVSLVTADAARAEGRDCHDLLTIGDVVRDGAGRIVGCITLRRVVPPTPTAAACRRYLARTGWRLHQESDARIEIYARDDVRDDRGRPLWLHLPARAGTVDEGRFAAKVVGLLAAVEKRSEAAVAEAIGSDAT